MAKKWIKGAIKRPGALRAAAKSAGAMTPRGTIKKSWLRTQAKKKGRRGKQARLAQTLGKMRKGRRNAEPTWRWRRVTGSGDFGLHTR